MLDLGDVVLAHQLTPNNEDGDSELEFLDRNVASLFNVLATCGTGIQVKSLPHIVLLLRNF